ncbi:MAG: glycosyltransferase family 2 protein [Hyphomicrobiales bacterium]
MQKPTVSYISAVYNKADVLLETLAFLQRQEGVDPNSVEFVFSDDGSTDGSKELLLAEMRKDDRIKVIQNESNAGPSLRINQAANMATGNFLVPIDADDFLPANATDFLMNCARTQNVPLVFGQSKRGMSCPNIDKDAQVSLIEDALAYCAKKSIVHMGFLVKASIWENAQGANPEVFIQDQSLPLRLSAEAQKLAYVHDVVYWLRPAGNENLSQNIAQQHHDRFFSAWPMLKNRNASQAAKKALMRQIISTLWKQHRDANTLLPQFSTPFVRYILNRAVSYGLSDAALTKASKYLLSLPDIRRPGVDV